MKVSIEYRTKRPDKVRVSVNRLDLFDVDQTLARIIYPVLKKYRRLYTTQKGYVGYPMEFAADPMRPEGPDNPDRYDDWVICLDKMVYAFEWIAKGKSDGPEEDAYYKACIKLLRPHGAQLKKLEFNARLTRENEITAEFDKEFESKAEAHRAKTQEGLDLFAKYYLALWT